MPSRSSSREPPRPIQLAVDPDEARARIRNRLEAADSLLRQAMIASAQELEVFKGQAKSWSTVTYELLRRIFDSDEYANQFLMARGIYISSSERPDIEFERAHESLRDQFRELETILDLIDVVQGIPNPVRPSPAVPPSTRASSGPVVNVTNSTVGTLNLGEIKGAIENKISTLAPSAGDFKAGMSQVMEATLADDGLSQDRRREALEHLETLTDYAKLEPPERKAAVINSVLLGLNQILQLGSTAHTVWDQWQQTISGFLR